MTGKHEKKEENTDLGLLTKDEQAAVQMCGALHELITVRILGNGPARWGDHAEVTAAIHVLQHMIMAQAAARAYPDWFRLLGEGVAVDDDPEAAAEIQAALDRIGEEEK